MCVCQQISKRCPVHNVIKSGDPLRCLRCEPDDAEAVWVRRQFTREELDHWTEEDGERVERMFVRKDAEHSALVN